MFVGEEFPVVSSQHVFGSYSTITQCSHFESINSRCRLLESMEIDHFCNLTLFKFDMKFAQNKKK